MTYRIEVRCDGRDDLAARDPKSRCQSNDNATPSAEHQNVDVAISTARRNARDQGWTQCVIDNARRKGFLCPPCAKRRGKD
tara:strand:- start:135 stop:377 length:243 start_codon:yes stop_codon:yes gene_type:complete